jgi:hypothetical protein
MLRSNSDKTPYELWKGRPTNIKHFRAFGSKCYIKREDEKFVKFDSRVDKGILVGYSRKIGIQMLQSETQQYSGKYKCKN